MKADEVFAILKKRIEQGGVTDETIKKIVEQYFEEHPVQITTDSTLLIEGMPADAKATGNKLNGLEEKTNSLEEKTNSLKEDIANQGVLENGFLIIKNSKGEELFRVDLADLCGDIDRKGSISVDVTELIMNEGGEITFGVKLANKPTNDQIVNVSSSNSNVTVSPQELIFTNVNYSEYQTVTVTSIDDEDMMTINGNITLSSNGVTSVIIAFVVTDNDSVTYYTMTLDDVTITSAAQSKIVVRGYSNENEVNVLIPNTLNDLPVWLLPSYPGTGNLNVSNNIENLTFEEDSVVTGELKIYGASLKTITNVPSGITVFDTGSRSPYAPNLKYVSGLENNESLTSFTMMSNTSLKQPPILNVNAPITNLIAAFSRCTAMEYDISNYVIPNAVTKISQLFRYCTGIYGNFEVDKNYTFNDCTMALGETSCKEVTVTDLNFAIPWALWTGRETLRDYTPLNGEAQLNMTKSYKINMYHDSQMYKKIREAYAGMNSEILQYDFECIDGYTPTKNITFYGDSQLRSFGNVTSQLLGEMSDDVFLWNLAIRGGSSKSYKPLFDKFTERYSDVTVLWLLTNDTGLSSDETMANIKYYVDSLETDKYIILGTWYYHYDELKSRNELLETTYGEHYLDIHQYTLDNWETITGLTPTEEDTTAVANDTIPPSLIDTDNVHENDYGGLVIATAIKEKLIALGYIDNTWLATTE